MSRFALRAMMFSAAVLGAATPARAQWPVTKLKNVKVLPADIAVDALVDTMKAFTRALGVRLPTVTRIAP